MLRILLLCVGIVGITFMVRAQEPVKQVTVRWYGQSMFQIETSLGKKIVLDPHAIPEFGRTLVQADVVTTSHWHSDHVQLGMVENAKSARIFHGLDEAKKGKTGDWKKTDEKVGAIRVRSVGLFHDADEGMSRGKSTAFVIEVDGLTYCHLGDLGHELNAAQLKAVGPVDVLMIPVGGIYALNGEQARKVVAQIKPRLYVFPMHYGVPGYDDLLSVDEFLDGPIAVKKLNTTNEFTLPIDAKSESVTIIILGWKKDVNKKP